MRDLTNALVELIRLASTDLSPDVETALIAARERETQRSAARGAMDSILRNVTLARENSTPICQDTGTPIFYVKHSRDWSTRALSSQIREATARATTHTYLRPNAVDAISGVNSGNNLGDNAFPTIHFDEMDDETLTVDLMLKGGGCENVGAQYSLPNTALGAGRDLEGVRKVALDAVYKAQGRGCAPGILGIAVGGDRGSSYAASKEVLLRKLSEPNPIEELDRLEERLKSEANQLGIGPMGFGGETTVLGVRICGMHRLPASYFVSVSYMCWAYRRRRMIVRSEEVIYE